MLHYCVEKKKSILHQNKIFQQKKGGDLMSVKSKLPEGSWKFLIGLAVGLGIARVFMG